MRRAGTLVMVGLIQLWIGTGSGRTLAAETLRAPPQCNRVIHMAARPIGRMLMVNAVGELIGPLRNFLDLVGPRHGCRIDYETVSIARGLAMLQSGETDLFAGARTSDRDALARYIHLFNSRLALITLADRGITIASVEALVHSQVTLDVQRGYDFGHEYRHLMATLEGAGRLSLTAGQTEIAVRLADGQTDATLVTPAGFVDAAAATAITSRVRVVPLLGLPPVDGGIYLVERQLGAENSAALSAAIHDGLTRGEYEPFLRNSVGEAGWAMIGVDFTLQPSTPAPSE